MILTNHCRYIGEEKINQIIKEREESTQFDISWLEHLDEKPLKEDPCKTLN